MQQILNLLSPTYLFNKNLGPFTSSLAWVFLGLLVLGLLVTLWLRLKVAKNKDIFTKKVIKRFFSLVWTMGWIGIILWMFRQVNAQFVSAPFLLLIWALISAVWLGFVLKYWLKTVPDRRKRLALEASRKQYLP